jgi:hypothetical protein
VRGEERPVEAGHRLGPGEVRPRDEPAQAPVARRVACQQDEVWTALRLPDPADVLLHRIAMTGQPGALRARPIRLALACGRVLRSAARRRTIRPRASAAPDAATRRDHDPVRVRDERVAQLDLDPEDRPQPDLLARRRRADDPVEALVIGDAEPGQAELDRPLGQLVRRRRAVEEREVRVAVELRVGRHEPARIEHLFEPRRTPRVLPRDDRNCPAEDATQPPVPASQGP